MDEQAQGAEKEYYHYSYQELCQFEGSARALELVQQYKNLSNQYDNCPLWLIHHCRLLTTYENPVQPLRLVK